MAYEVGYPVDFRSGGDTTREAFSKHINEIKRIYSYLNELDASLASAATDIADAKKDSASVKTDLATHKTSTNPHPNMQITESQLPDTFPQKWVATMSISIDNVAGLSVGLNRMNDDIEDIKSEIAGDFDTFQDLYNIVNNLGRRVNSLEGNSASSFQPWPHN